MDTPNTSPEGNSDYRNEEIIDQGDNHLRDNSLYETIMADGSAVDSRVPEESLEGANDRKAEATEERDRTFRGYIQSPVSDWPGSRAREEEYAEDKLAELRARAAKLSHN